MKKLNLVGQTFGRLKVLEEDNKREEEEKEKTGKHLNTLVGCSIKVQLQKLLFRRLRKQRRCNNRKIKSRKRIFQRRCSSKTFI